MQLHPDASAALDAQRIELAGGDYDRQEYLQRREERIQGGSRYLAYAIPTIASIATGGYGMALPWYLKVPAAMSVNGPIN